VGLALAMDLCAGVSAFPTKGNIQVLSRPKRTSRYWRDVWGWTPAPGFKMSSDAEIRAWRGTLPSAVDPRRNDARRRDVAAGRLAQAPAWKGLSIR
jgi:hypothetical protein